MIYAFNATTFAYIGQFYSLAEAKTDCADKNPIYMEEVPTVDYISKITFVDGVCIYNNKTFWTTTAWTDIKNDFANHTVLDWMNQTVDSIRFNDELYSNANRLNQIDGQLGETRLNQVVGKELISLLMSEFSQTTVSAVYTADIAAKCSNIGIYLSMGSFKMAESYISSLATDEFFTTDRIAKYLNMIKSADVFTYAA